MRLKSEYCTLFKKKILLSYKKPKIFDNHVKLFFEEFNFNTVSDLFILYYFFIHSCKFIFLQPLIIFLFQLQNWIVTPKSKRFCIIRQKQYLYYKFNIFWHFTKFSFVYIFFCLKSIKFFRYKRSNETIFRSFFSLNLE